MAGLSNYQRGRLGNHMLGGVQDTPDVTVYAALCKTVPSATLTGTTIDEADYTGYARVAITNNATNFPAMVAGAQSNGSTIIFPPVTGSTHSAKAMVFCDAATVGNVICWGILVETISLFVGETPNFAPGAITIQIL